MDDFEPRSNTSKEPSWSAQKTILSAVSTSLLSLAVPTPLTAKGVTPLSPILIAVIGVYFPFPVPNEKICVPLLTSHNLIVPSLAADNTFRPRDIIAVDVMARVWPFNILAGAGTLGTDDDSVRGNSAGRIVRVKSAPAVNNTRDDGKNCTDVTVLR